MKRNDLLLPALVTYAAASLFHHMHNAEFLDHYPNMPASVSPASVYAAWIAMTAIGFIGYLSFRGGYRITGLMLLGIHGLIGLGGLAHYVLAPWSAHTLAMHLSIVLETAGALGMLAAVAGLASRTRIRA